jgi:SAM-dependent methyltransferase
MGGGMSLKSTVWNFMEYPHRLQAVEDVLRAPGSKLLDVGCGNHSPSIVKRHFPHVTYHGVDRENWNRDDGDVACIDRFFDLDLDDDGALDAVEDDAYDAVICNHVLEHLADPVRVAGQLATKLRSGGRIYLEVPSARSLDLPRAEHGWMGIKGCLNFWDDPTHKQIVDLRDVVGPLQDAGCTVDGPSPRFQKRRVALLPLYVGAGLATRGYIPASVVWDITGMAERVIGTRS